MTPPAVRLAADELPHTGAMRWIEEVSLSIDGRTASATITLAAGHPSMRGGRFLPAALIEYMAQTAAAGAALNARARKGRIGQGVLAAIPEFEMFAPAPHAGDTLIIQAHHTRTVGQLSQSDCTAHMGPTLLARARLTFHIQFV